jgi:FecR protein
MQVTVTTVTGTVQYRTAEDQPWRPCTIGLVLGEGAEFRTGIRSAVTFELPPNQTITLDRLGTIKVLQAVKQKNAYKTDVGMKYGRTHYEVQAAGIEHESTVRTPNSTLAVRGTNMIVSDQRPFPPEAIHYDGLAEWESGNRKQVLSRGLATAIGNQAAADTALLESVVDPNIAFARTPNEVPLVTHLLSQGGIFELGQNNNIPIVHGGTPPTDAQLPKLLPGQLDFVLRWDGPANLDLEVNNQAVKGGETLYPATNLNTTPSGGVIPFDHRGGPHGGIEVAYWRSNYSPGLYDLVVNAISGATVNYKVDFYEKGVHEQIDDVAANNGMGALVQTLTGSISKGDVAIGIAGVGGVLPPIIPPIVPPPPPPPPGGPPVITPPVIPTAQIARQSRR